MAWRVGLFGWLALILASMVLSAIVFDLPTVLPADNLLLYIWHLVQALLLRGLVLLLLAAIMAGWLRGLRLWAQTTLFAAAAGIVLPAIWATTRLVLSLLADAELGYSEATHLRTIWDGIARGPGITLVVGAIAGWLFAYRSLRRQADAP